MREKGFEPENLSAWFRSRPGFLKLQVNERIDAIFVKFETAEGAEWAIRDAGAEGMAVDWARRNLDDERQVVATPAFQLPTAPRALEYVHTSGVGCLNGLTDAGHDVDARPLKRPRAEEVDTIVVMGIRAGGIRQGDLISWLSQRPGFVTHKSNERIDGVFVKFASSVDAARALHDANAEGYGADWAHRNLDVDEYITVKVEPSTVQAPWRTGPVGTAPFPAACAGGGALGGAELDTVAVVGMRAKGYKQEDLQEWFSRRPQFVGLKLNVRVDSMFLKFASAAAADQAIRDANAEGISAEWARRNLDDPDQFQQAP
jgi:hypothetical protein